VLDWTCLLALATLGLVLIDSEDPTSQAATGDPTSLSVDCGTDLGAAGEIGDFLDGGKVPLARINGRDHPTAQTWRQLGLRRFAFVMTDDVVRRAPITGELSYDFAGWDRLCLSPARSPSTIRRPGCWWSLARATLSLSYAFAERHRGWGRPSNEDRTRPAHPCPRGRIASLRSPCLY